MKSFIAALLALLFAVSAFAQTAGLMPMAEQQFFDNNGNPLSAGTVTTYVVGTTTLKTTWQDAGETIPNTNPIVLNAAGRAIIYGDGNYRQIVRDRNGNLIWDAVTSAFGTGSAALFGDGAAVGTILPWSGITAPVRYVFAYGQELSRSTYSALYAAITITANVNCNSGSPILTGFSDTTQIPIGAPVEVTCVAVGTIVISKTGSTVTVSNNAIISTSVAAKFFPWGNGNATTTFNVPDLRGRVLPGRDNMGGTAAARLSLTYYGVNPDGLGAAGGAQSKTLATTNLPAYTPAGTIVSTDAGHKHFTWNTDAFGAAPPAVSSTTQAGFSRIGGGDSDYAIGGSATAATVGLTSSTAATITSTFTGTAQGGVATAFATIQPSMTMNYVVKILPDTNISTTNVVTSLGGMIGDITCGSGVTCSSQTISVTPGVGTGDVIGPTGAIKGQVSVFADSTGKLLALGSIGISVTAYASCNGIADDTSNVVTAINATPAGGTLFIPATGCLVSGSGSATFTLTSPITITGQGASPAASVGGFVLATGFPTNRDLFKIVGVTGQTLRGWYFNNFNVTAQSGCVGKNVFNFDNTASATTGFAEIVIDKVNLPACASAGGYSILLNNGASVNPNGGSFNVTISNNYIAGGINCIKCGDSIRSEKNIITGDNVGWLVDQVASAGGFVSDKDNITANGGCIVIKTATNPVIEKSTICEIGTTTNANLAGIDIQGPVTGGHISGAIQASVGTNATSLIRVAGATGLSISGARLGEQAGVTAIRTINTSASPCIMADIYYTGGGTDLNDAATTPGCTWKQAQDFKNGIYVENNSATIDASHILAWGTPAAAAAYIYGQATFGGVAGAGFRLVNNAGNVALNFGGDTASFPSISQSSTTVAIKLADASAYAPFEALTVLTSPTVVASLTTCNAGAKGKRWFVTDSNATTTAGIGAVVAGGGANNVPVFCDGTSWRIG